MEENSDFQRHSKGEGEKLKRAQIILDKIKSIPIEEEFEPCGKAHNEPQNATKQVKQLSEDDFQTC